MRASMYTITFTNQDGGPATIAEFGLPYKKLKETGPVVVFKDTKVTVCLDTWDQVTAWVNALFAKNIYKFNIEVDGGNHA